MASFIVMLFLSIYNFIRGMKTAVDEPEWARVYVILANIWLAGAIGVLHV